ncbi:hypothetical protein [Leptospira sp. GIMC2001]|uniref:hypothetical protein n=1 Tax=Leptospira sp. GIMC2001 TaxID=1513297 RepID=UPI0023490334|nr:hypothetical protein [Leptospira sp. GIMC2001]WCL47915.1 hypothetical protein O4O04_11335 [Leptospira sp. GIMC2001]
MKASEYLNRLKTLDSILQETGFLLQNNEFPIYNLSKEPYPDEFPLVFNPSKINITSEGDKILNSEGEVIALDGYLTRNFACKKCSDRSMGIRGFLQRGRKKLLILHYTGETGMPGSSFIKKSSKTLFRSKEVEESFTEWIQEGLNTSYEEFHYQEYPACRFHKGFEVSDWHRRANLCDIHVEETVRKEGIKAILVLGSSALLRWPSEYCKANAGKLLEWKFSDGLKIPYLITRSPEALLHCKIKKPSEYKNMLTQLSEHLRILQKKVGDFN